MRKRTLNVTVSAIILVLTLSFVAVVPVTGQDTGAILSKLEELQGKVKDLNPPALENKVKAVMHQIEAGAFNGALNKLQNDVRGFIQAQVDNPEDLIELVDEIIDLINGITPPHPATPDFELSAEDLELKVAQGKSNATIITVTSINNFNQEVALTSSTTASGITLSLNTSSLMPPRNGTVAAKLNVTAANDATPGNYKITVTGTSVGFSPKTEKIELEVIATTPPPPPPPEDETPPTIVSVLRSPESPAYNETVTVTAFVFDTGGSGLKKVTLNFTIGSDWTPVEMVLSEGLYEGSIPAFPFDTSVEYRVHASDNNGNVAASSLHSYDVIDPFPPLLRIDRPTQGSYLSGIVAVTVFMKDQNSGGESGFASAELTINGTTVKTWEQPAPAEPDTFNWNTAAFGVDGVYIVKLTVRDRAGNVVEKSLTATVDNTLPTALINAPEAGSNLRLSVLIRVTGSDSNFDKMEVRIDDELVRTSFTSGTEVLEWNTRSRGEGMHSIALTVFDKAGNIKQAFVNVTADNTPPLIGTPSWSPKEPAANQDIQINTTATEPTFGSGVQNVTLWFKNTTNNDWQPIPMEFKNNINWTITIKNQSDTIVKFFIEAFDKAGNKAETEDQFEFTVAGPSGSPLIWILVAIAVIAAASGGAYYYVRQKQKKTETSPSAPVASSKPSSPPPPEPTSLPMKKLSRRRSPRQFTQLLDTLLSAKNAPKVDYSKYINA